MTSLTTSSFDAPFKILRGILGYWTSLIQGLLEVGPARLLVAVLGDLGVSTLRSIKTITQFSSVLSIKPAILPASMLGGYSTNASSTPSCFPHRTDLLGNPFLTTSLLDLLFFLPFWTIIPAILPATMLGYYSGVHLRCPLNCFIIVLIYWKPASCRSSLDLSPFGKTTNRSASKLICFFLFFFLFGPTCMLFDCR
jgi:hypothetical protein